MTLDEAKKYLSPHPSSHGPIILNAVTMRRAIGIIQEQLNRVSTLEIQASRLKAERDALWLVSNSAIGPGLTNAVITEVQTA